MLSSLDGDARLKDAVLHILGDAAPIIDDDDLTEVVVTVRRNVDVLSAGIARIAQQLDDHILDMLDIVLSLPALSLRDTQADIALAEVLLDAQVGLAVI